jgi:DNA-binding beta-propeller fold protein YncE
LNTTGGYPLTINVNRCGLRRSIAIFVACAIVAAGCSTNPLATSPATIEPAGPAASPPPATRPAGEILPLGGNPDAAVFDERTGSLAVLTLGAQPPAAATLTLFSSSGVPRELTLPGPATAIAGDGQGSAYLSTHGGYLTVDLAAGTATPTSINEEADTDFTAIARRADGRLVLGSADGTAYTLGSDTAVAEKVKLFARVDAVVTEGNNAVVLDRGQTSVTSLNSDGRSQQSLRAGQGATTLVADPLGRVLVTDTRGGQLLVFGVDPLIERQAYPVPDAPYGLAGSRNLTWVSQTASNMVVGYDLTTGIPVEKVRYPTVQQPNSLAFDDKSDTLYVVSAAGAGVQVIRNAAGAR